MLGMSRQHQSPENPGTTFPVLLPARAAAGAQPNKVQGRPCSGVGGCPRLPIAAKGCLAQPCALAPGPTWVDQAWSRTQLVCPPLH